MSGTSLRTLLLPRGPAPTRRRRVLAWTGAVLVLAVAALLAAAIVPGSHSTSDPQGSAVASVAHAPSDARAGAGRPARRVFDSTISAKRYGELDAAYDEGVTASGQLISADPPVPSSQFRRPIAEYRRYAEGWAVRLAGASAALTAALRSGDRATARLRWDSAFSDYLHLGAVYGLLPGTLDDQLAEVPPSAGTARFPGLHRIEKGLWTGQRVGSLVTVAIGVQHATTRLRRVLPTVSVSPLDFALRAHEILEDAQRDLMSGLDVPWSRAGVLGTAAGLAADRELIATLAPLLAGRDNTLGSTRFWLARLGETLRAVRRPDGSYPALGRLRPLALQRIDGVLAGTLSALSQIPPALETYHPSIPRLPRSVGSR